MWNSLKDFHLSPIYQTSSESILLEMQEYIWMDMQKVTDAFRQYANMMELHRTQQVNVIVHHVPAYL